MTVPAQLLDEQLFQVALLEVVADTWHTQRHTFLSSVWSGKSQRTDDTRFLGLLFLVNNTQAVFFTQLDHRLGQVFITDATAELAVQDVDGHLPQRIAVDVFNGSAQLLAIEQRVFDLIGVALEPFIGAEPGT